MSEKLELINSKIELLQDQILDLQQSGFFTEMEIEKLSRPLRIELAAQKVAKFIENKNLQITNNLLS